VTGWVVPRQRVPTQPPLGKIEESGQFVELTFILPTRGWKFAGLHSPIEKRKLEMKISTTPMPLLFKKLARLLLGSACVTSVGLRNAFEARCECFLLYWFLAV